MKSINKNEAEIYEIRLRGQLDKHWLNWFDGFAMTQAENGDTILMGLVADQSALHGLLKKVRDVGLPLHSLICLSSTDNRYTQ